MQTAFDSNEPSLVVGFIRMTGGPAAAAGATLASARTSIRMEPGK